MPSYEGHWRHLANTIELVLAWAHPSLQPKRQLDWFSRFCTAHGRKSLYFTKGAPFSKIGPSHGVSGPHLTHDSSEPIRARNPNGISLGLAVFAQMTTECPYTLQWDAPFPCQNYPLPMGDLRKPHLIHGFLGPPESSIQTTSRSIQPFLQGWLQCDRSTDRPTDHATRSVTIDRIYVRSTAMRPNNTVFVRWYVGAEYRLHYYWTITALIDFNRLSSH